MQNNRVYLSETVNERSFRLDGRLALVTGASRGMGRAISLAFARAGADVVLVARGRQNLEQVASEIRSMGRKAWIFPFDLTRVEEIPSLYRQILRTCGTIDILLNNAGTIHRQEAVEFPLSEWQRVLMLNLTAPFVLSQQFARQLIQKKKPGKILNIASLLSEVARAKIPAYAASKGGIRQLTKALAVEWAPYRINVNAIGPGYIETELTRPLIEDEQFNRWVIEHTPWQRWGQPDDIASVALFLASPASNFISGQIIYVDGGWLASL